MNAGADGCLTAGTSVAKRAASLILINDDFPAIVAAVEQGRVIYGNIQK
jgi:magnesium-transporting ATPase (P-type)